jgi:zinc transport system substrate-binding protein
MIRTEGQMRAIFRRLWILGILVLGFVVFQAVLAAASTPTAASPPDPYSDKPAPQEPVIKVVASIFPISNIVTEIGDGKVNVTTIVQPGADPHEFEVTPMTALAIDRADIVFYISPSFDGWAVGSEKTGIASRSFEFAKIFDDSLIRTGRDINPHIWLDPLFAKTMGQAVAQELSRIDPAHAEFFLTREAIFSSSIDSLDAWVKAEIRASGLKDFVSFHPAWTYFARRYALRERGVLELTPEQEPSAKQIAEVIRMMKRQGIKLVFAEEFSNLALAEMVAQDSGARVIVLDDLGGETRPGRDTYSGLIRYDVTKMADAMREVAPNR